MPDNHHNNTHGNTDYELNDQNWISNKPHEVFKYDLK